MEWSEFLNDHGLNSGMHPTPPNGKLLFKKVVHDTLECLSGYKECIRIVTTLKENIPGDTVGWLVKWEGSIDMWSRKIILLDKQFGELPSDSLDWPNLIAEVGTILTQVPELRNDAEALTLPTSEKLMLTIQIAIRLTEKLVLIWNDIQAKEYKRLWTLQWYGNLIE